MAGLRAWFRQISQAVEEEVAKQRGDNMRARHGYGNEEPEPDAAWEPERGNRSRAAAAKEGGDGAEPLEPQRSGKPCAGERDATCARDAWCTTSRPLSLGHERVTRVPALRS